MVCAWWREVREVVDWMVFAWWRGGDLASAHHWLTCPGEVVAKFGSAQILAVILLKEKSRHHLLFSRHVRTIY